jgi:two-component system, chemotaxis family, protein-glutamate methylesterase/glutaminase
MTRSTIDPRPGGQSRDPLREELGPLGVPGTPTGLTCPRCGGVLGEDAEEGQMRLECRAGHAVVLDALLDAKAAAVEDALWAAVRALDEKAALTGRMSQRAHHRDDVEAARRYGRVSQAASRRADIVRDILNAHHED